MQPEIIHRHLKSLMAMKGITQADIARSLSMTRQNVNRVLKGQVKTKKVRQELCQALGITLEDIWP